MNRYHCLAPALRLPPEIVEASSGIEARKLYARLHDLPDTLEVISRRADLIDATWLKLEARQ